MTTNKASYCQFQKQETAKVFANLLTDYGIPTKVERINISPYASTDPEDREMPDDYRYAVTFDKQLEPKFLAMREAAKAAGMNAARYLMSLQAAAK